MENAKEYLHVQEYNDNNNIYALTSNGYACFPQKPQKRTYS